MFRTFGWQNNRGVHWETKKQDEINTVPSEDSDEEPEFHPTTITKSIALQSFRNIQMFLTSNNVAAWDCLNELDNIIHQTILKMQLKRAN